jgi:hypothetical protein
MYRCRRYIRSKLFFDTPGAKQTVFLASSARSGSTWLQEIIRATDRYRVIFEPFHSERLHFLRDWMPRQYIYRYNSDIERLRKARRIIDGQIHSMWTDKLGSAFFPTKRLIKDVRANLLLGWLKQNFPQLKLVFLIRHPIRVALSRMRLGWDVDLRILFDQNEVMFRHFGRDQEFLASIRDPFLQQVAFWLIENLVALRELEVGEMLFIRYEDLLVSPMDHLRRLFCYLETESPANLDPLVDSPSITSWTDRSSYNSGLTKSQIENAMRMLGRFGLDRIYPEADSRLCGRFDHDSLKTFVIE